MALLTHLLACAFGMGSWVAVNGLWVEVPLLVTVLPEQWYLPSYITIIIQIANVGPLFVTLMNRFRPGLLKEVAVIYAIVSVGVLACLLLAFLWSHTSVIAGTSHSIPFLILTFFLALVDCTSSVTFLPFMMQLQPQYTNTFFIGEGLSGLIPALIALGQGSGISSCTNVSIEVNITTGNETVGNTTFQLETSYLPPNFSTLVFFLLMTAMMLTCLLAFFFLTRQPKVWELSQQHLFPSSIVLNSFDQILDEGADSQLSKGCSCPKDPKGPGDILPQKVSYSLSQLILIYLLITWVSALTNGVLPSVQSYSCLPYGHTTYHLAATLSSMANPLACIVAMFLPSRWVPGPWGSQPAAHRGLLPQEWPLLHKSWGCRHRVGEGLWGARPCPGSTDTPGKEDGASKELGCAACLCCSPGTGGVLHALTCPLQVPDPDGHPHRGRDRLWCLQHGHRRDESLPAPAAVPVGRCHHRKSRCPSHSGRSLTPHLDPTSPRCPHGGEALALTTLPPVPAGPLLGAVHRDALLHEGDGRGDPAEPQPQRAGLVRGAGAAGLPPRGAAHVPPCQRLRPFPIC